MSVHIDISITKETIQYLQNVVAPQLAIAAVFIAAIVIGVPYLWEKYVKDRFK